MCRPDVVITDIRIEPAYALLFEGGSEGRAYLLKERVGDGDELAAAVKRVSEGGTVVDPKVVDALMRDRSRAKSSALERLTEREREVLEQMATGASEVAQSGHTDRPIDSATTFQKRSKRSESLTDFGSRISSERSSSSTMTGTSSDPAIAVVA